MSDFVCPAEIAALFEREETSGRGRDEAVKWTKMLLLSAGDRVWLPEIGWREYDPSARIQ